jgi:hypothetical protein
MKSSYKKQIKVYIKTRFPALTSLGRRLFHFYLKMRTPESVFIGYYKRNVWGDNESYSGSGSNLAQTAVIRQEIPMLVKQFACHSLLDIPCGDFYWMNHTSLTAVEYTGGDIVEELIKRNQTCYSSPTRRFVKLNLIIDPLPKVDLILCRDCLVHFSYDDIIRALKNMRSSGSHYLLTTSFVDRNYNIDIPTGSWRPLNLQIAPFNFPAPLAAINEQCTENDGIYYDKHLSLWRFADLVL